MNRDYDAIIIGSGIGALTTAALLAKGQKWRVLLLERHFKAGGFTHEFARKQKFQWDVGIHYVGDMGDGMSRRLFDYITDGRLQWRAMPRIFEKFVYPDLNFAVPSNPVEYQAALTTLFPAEAAAIGQYFVDIKNAAQWFTRQTTFKFLPSFIGAIGGVFRFIKQNEALTTTGEYLNKHFRDERLKGLLASQWGDYGLPPSSSAFAIHALIVSHYLQGGYYPVGGAGRIAEFCEGVIRAAGGEIFLSHTVKEILVEKNRARGVRVVKTQAREEIVADYYAPVVVSNAGAYNTYLGLIPDSVPIPFRSELRAFHTANPGTSCVTLYLGLKESAEKLGFHGENHWIYQSYDHNQNFSGAETWLRGKGKIPGAYLSFPSLKNPQAAGHTAEIIAFAPYDFFRRWRDQPWKKRDTEYQALKANISAGLLSLVEERYPGFRDLVEYSELSTPLTNEHFTGHPQGAIYGLPCVPDRFRPDKSPWVNATTPISGLYLTGTDASSPGIVGAMFGGLAAAAQILGFVKLMRLFKDIGA